MDKLCNCKSNFLEFTINACKMNPSRLVREDISDLVQNIKKGLNQACNCHSQEEPKPECDHIVGKIDFSEDHLYEMSWTELKEFFLERDITWHLTDMENIRLKWMGSIASDFVPFDHCHLCGEKIDLQAVIESTKKLNLKKDE